MNASADIQTKTHTDALAVPINAVTTRDKNGDKQTTAKEDKKASNDDNSNNPPTPVNSDDLDEVVYVLQPDKITVRRVKVRTDIQDINYIEILGGLKGGEEVITGPYSVVSKTLKDGDKVKVVPKEQLFEDTKGK
jgi:HlyD family secretion protein